MSLDSEILAELRKLNNNFSGGSGGGDRTRTPTLGASGETEESLERRRQLYDQILNRAKATAEINEAEMDIQENLRRVEEKKLEIQKALREDDTRKAQALGEQLKGLNETNEQLEKQKDLIREANDGADQLAKSFGSLFSGKAPDLKGMLDPKNIQGLAKNLKGLTNVKNLSKRASQAAVLALYEYSKAAINLAIDLGDMETQFMKATGANQQFARSITNSYQETRKFGATDEETSAAGQTLFNSFTDFTLASQNTRENLVETSAVLAKMGVSNEDFAKSIQTSTKAMGMSADQAAQNMLNLEKFAENLGVAPQALAADFAGAGDMLAKMGDQGTKAFKDLAIVSKTTGMSMQSLVAITNKFDTFDGAADQAGRLNAALGGNFVNAMDLMMATDPAERFGMIRDSILDAGLSFDEMSYYQKNFYKDSLGLSDVGELAALLSGDMDLVSGATQESGQSMIDAKKRAQEMATFQERLNMAFAQMIPIITPLIDLISDFTLFIADNMTTIKVFTGIILILGSYFLGPVGAIAALVLGLGILFDTIKVGNDKVSALNVIFAEVKSAFDVLFEPISQIFDALGELFSLISDGSGEAEPLLYIITLLGKNLARSITMMIAPLTIGINLFNVLLQLIRGIARGDDLEDMLFGSLGDSLKAIGAIIFKIFDPFIYVIYTLSDALKDTLPAFGKVTDAIDGIANFLFEKQYASNFLEGIVKLANAFSSMAAGMAENLNPFTAMSKLVDSIGNAFTGIIGAVSSFFSIITDPAGAENIAKISEAIVAIPIRKNIEFATSMAALAAANTAAGALGTTQAVTKAITGGNNQNNTTSAATPYEVTINVMLDRDKLATVVEQINGQQAKNAIQGIQ